MTTYGVLGVGSIAKAVVTGLCEGVAAPPELVLSPRGAATAAALSGRYETVRVAEDNQAVLDAADVVLVCLRTTDTDVLADLTWRPDHVVVSATAALGVPRLLALVAPATRVCRSVPMPPVAERAGLTAVHPPLQEARALFDRLGSTLEVEEVAAYEALSATSATLSGFFGYLATQTAWLQRQGIGAEDARSYVAATYAGALGQLEGGAGFDELAAEYATPGGVNEQVARELRESGAYVALDRALDGAHHRLATE
ncbi:NAD(P)-binding domain-containing protein [Nocardioides anomalus]|uniref:NAD(P)-binding domain-containing protein n=1 Tax=Nocardioides anomalus TaxID=2712223 RepID=A0A6G6WCJ0_9ACTN|nr:NAD(P)-binding domain-containing protein [Nocardioides anomalus]QIG43048.1 NAD(P)-binding domain-containing protein [Nocardioides anomalus]